jgi:hypothetical protein
VSLVESCAAASAMEGLLAHRPELLTKFRTFYESFWDDELVPLRVLELARFRIALIHDCAAEQAITDPQVELSEADQAALARADFNGFTAAERCALELAELMPHGVHRISDAQVHAASAHFGHPGCVSLLTALSFFDVACRLKLVFELPATAVSRQAGVLL